MCIGGSLECGWRTKEGGNAASSSGVAAVTGGPHQTSVRKAYGGSSKRECPLLGVASRASRWGNRSGRAVKREKERRSKSRASHEGCTDTSGVDVSSNDSRTAGSGSRTGPRMLSKAVGVGGASTGRKAGTAVDGTGNSMRARAIEGAGSVRLAVESVEMVDPSDDISSRSGSSLSVSESSTKAACKKSSGPSWSEGRLGREEAAVQRQRGLTKI